MKNPSSNHLMLLPALGVLGYTLIASSQASLIAHYDFTDGNLLDNEIGGSANYTLTKVSTGTGDVTINPDGSAHFTGINEANSSYLETPGVAVGVPNFTVSFWFKTSIFNQGSFKGLFSNNTGGSSTAFSWQVDLTGTDIRVRSQQGATIDGGTTGYSTDTWYHVAVTKGGTGDASKLYVSELGSGTVSLIGTDPDNLGGLQMFRLGVNRLNDGQAEMDMANVKIYDDVNINLNTLLAEGPQTVPEPSSALLVGLGGLSFILRHRR